MGNSVRYLLPLMLFLLGCDRKQDFILMGTWSTSTSSCADIEKGARPKPEKNKVVFTNEEMIIHSDGACAEKLFFSLSGKSKNSFKARYEKKESNCKSEIKKMDHTVQAYTFNKIQNTIMIRSNLGLPVCNVLIKE